MAKGKRPSKILGQQLKRWRSRFTDEELAARVKELGGGLGRVAITKIANGKRGVSLDEALLLAAALNVPPPVLFFGLEPGGGRVEITRKNIIHPHLAAEWIAGEGPLATSEQSAMRQAEWWEAAWPLRLYRRLREAQNKAQKADSAVRRAEGLEESQAKIKQARVTFHRRLLDMVKVLTEMREAGVTPPKMPEKWVPKMRDLGWEGD